MRQQLMTYFQETMTCMHINSYKMYNLDDYSVIIFAPKTRNTELYSYEYLTVQYSRKKKKQYRQILKNSVSLITLRPERASNCKTKQKCYLKNPKLIFGGYLLVLFYLINLSILINCGGFAWLTGMN